MSLDKIEDERLFQNHSKEVISNWCKNLKYFHYMRARAGHSCEGDSFAAHFLYNGREDLINKLAQIGVTLNELGPRDLVFDPFESYSIRDLDKIKYTIPGCDDLEQPKDAQIFGHKVYIWVQSNRFEISISGNENDNAYTVSDEDFEVCKDLEQEFEALKWNIYIDKEIKDHPHCISQEKYPELYE